MNSGNVIASDDLLTELLRRLPSKSNARFRCVSKRFLSILTNPTFLRLHRLHLHPPPTALFLFRQASPHFTYLDLISLSPHHHKNNSSILDQLTKFHTNEEEIINIHTCKGLMCVHTFINPIKNKSVGSQNRVYIYNPLSFESRLIPKLNTKELMYNIVGVYIVFEPLCDHYDVVCAWERVIIGENDGFRDPRERDIIMFSFYSSKTRGWSACRAVLAIRKGDVEFQQGVVWNGNVHWFGWRRKLLCPDVGRECFRAMPKPLGFGVMRFWYFGEAGGGLYLIGNRDDLMSLDVMELDEDYSEWTVKHRVNLSSFLETKWFRAAVWTRRQTDKYSILGFNVLCFVDCRDGSGKLVISVGDKIVLYDTNGMEIQEIAKINPSKTTMVKRDVFEFKWFQVHQLIKTNVSL